MRAVRDPCLVIDSVRFFTGALAAMKRHAQVAGASVFRMIRL